MFLRYFYLILFTIFITPFIECKHQILKNETIIHLKFFDNCLNLFGVDSTDIRYKVSFASLDSPRTDDRYIDIFVLNDKDNKFQRQQLNGHLYNPKEFVLISINITGSVEKYPFIIELFKKDGSNNWINFAFSYLQPFDNKMTDGQVIKDVVNQNKNLIGSIKVDYLVIRPISGFNADANSMITIKAGAMMGHRGTGVGRRTDLKENILENTIEAFNYACRHKADMIELDIQLSKDKIPVIHHDFSAKVLLREKTGTNFETIEIPVKDLTYSEMGKISTVENMDFDCEDNQPFETLESVLEKVEPNCGINFEIKYPQMKKGGIWDGVKGLEFNEYIDIIVKTLYENIGNRTGIITSFHPDLCAMIHLKQNKFGVALLTSGDIVHWNRNARPIVDPRGTTIPLNTYFAAGMQLNGLSVYAKDLLANSSLIDFIKSYGQPLYVWGDLLNSSDVLYTFIKKKVDGLIFDKIDKIDTTFVVVSKPESSPTESGSVQHTVDITFLLLSVFIARIYY